MGSRNSEFSPKVFVCDCLGGIMTERRQSNTAATKIYAVLMIDEVYQSG